MSDVTLQKVYEKKAERFERDYGEYISVAAEMREAAFGKNFSWTTYDTVALGNYLKTWESFLPIFEEDSATRDTLGEPLKAGLGLVAVQYATLPVTAFASVQPLDEEAGLVYYRRLIATETRGGVTKGDTLGNSAGGVDALGNLDNYYGEEQATSTTVADASGSPSAGPYNFTLEKPVRPRTITISVKDGAFKGLDDGEGNIIGVNMTGTINYTTGELSLTLTDVSGVSIGDNIAVTYHQNLVEADTMPGFKWDLASKLIRANYFILQSQYTTFAEYVVKRRFGSLLSEDLAADAASQINAAVLTSAINKMKVAAGNTTVTWDGTVPSGVPAAEHRRLFYDALEEAATEIGNKTGRGSISFIVAGAKARRVLRTLGFKSDIKNVPGPYYAGDFDGVPVFFAPSSVMPDDTAIVGYRGQMWFEAPVVYSPFLPISTVKGQVGNNVFQNAIGVAHAAGLDAVVPEFTAKIVITNM